MVIGNNKVIADYRVGSDECGWSDLFWFFTFPSYDSKWSPKIGSTKTQTYILTMRKISMENGSKISWLVGY